jgi:tetratricopeptide (TPR) repeat protein
MIMIRTAILLFASLLGAGCFGHGLGIVEVSTCARPAAGGSNQPLQTPDLVEQGNDYLDSALRDLSRSDVLDVQTPLRQSCDCFGRALRLSPDSYEAQLSMSVAYLARARLAPEGSVDRVSLLEGARHMLGRAYMVRHGAYEPLYYLAEVAVAEGKLALARRLLEPLRIARMKEGPVNVLLGQLSERRGQIQEAATFYRDAVAAGWPAATLLFAASRYRELDGDKLPVSHTSAGGR